MIFHFEKHYTPAEANALIPWVRQVFAELHRILWPEESDPARPVSSNGNGNGNGHRNGNGHSAPESTTLNYGSVPKEARRDASEKLLEALREKGIVIQDVERGLIDFPSVINDREVFLCYQLSDGDRIQFYHDLESGFAGRRPLEGNE